MMGAIAPPLIVSLALAFSKLLMSHQEIFEPHISCDRIMGNEGVGPGFAAMLLSMG